MVGQEVFNCVKHVASEPVVPCRYRAERTITWCRVTASSSHRGKLPICIDAQKYLRSHFWASMKSCKCRLCERFIRSVICSLGPSEEALLTPCQLHRKMPSPLKKIKLNNGNKSAATQSKGLEYFFARQKDKSSAVKEGPSEAASELTDEELARKLQAEWDQEAANHAKSEEADLEGEVEDAKPEPKSQSASSKVEVKPSPAEAVNSKNPETPAGTYKSTLSLQSIGTPEDEVNSFIPLEESPLTFEPSKYVSQLREHWASEGGNASYALLTKCFVLVSATTSRIKIVDTLVNCLRVLIEGDFSSLLPAVSSTSLPLCVGSNLGRYGWQQTPYLRHTSRWNWGWAARPSPRL